MKLAKKILVTLMLCLLVISVRDYGNSSYASTNEAVTSFFWDSSDSQEDILPGEDESAVLPENAALTLDESHNFPAGD